MVMRSLLARRDVWFRSGSEIGRTVTGHARQLPGGQAPDQASHSGRAGAGNDERTSPRRRHEASQAKGHARGHRPAAQHASPSRARRSSQSPEKRPRAQATGVLRPTVQGARSGRTGPRDVALAEGVSRRARTRRSSGGQRLVGPVQLVGHVHAEVVEPRRPRRRGRPSAGAGARCRARSRRSARRSRAAGPGRCSGAPPRGCRRRPGPAAGEPAPQPAAGREPGGQAAVEAGEDGVAEPSARRPLPAARLHRHAAVDHVGAPPPTRSSPPRPPAGRAPPGAGCAGTGEAASQEAAIPWSRSARRRVIVGPGGAGGRRRDRRRDDSRPEPGTSPVSRTAPSARRRPGSGRPARPPPPLGPHRRAGEAPHRVEAAPQSTRRRRSRERRGRRGDGRPPGPPPPQVAAGPHPVARRAEAVDIGAVVDQLVVAGRQRRRRRRPPASSTNPTYDAGPARPSTSGVPHRSARRRRRGSLLDRQQREALVSDRERGGVGGAARLRVAALAALVARCWSARPPAAATSTAG